jgi:hypothetical protein
MIWAFPHMPRFSLCNRKLDLSETVLNVFRNIQKNSTDGGTQLVLKVSIYNPTRFDAVVKEVQIDFFFQGTYIGAGRFFDAKFPRGSVSDHTILAQFNIPSLAIAATMATNFLSGSMLLDLNHIIKSATVNIAGGKFGPVTTSFLVKDFDAVLENRQFCLCAADPSPRPY